MFGLFAVISFVVGFIMNGVGNDHSTWFSPLGWMLLGLAFLALQVLGAEGWIRNR